MPINHVRAAPTFLARAKRKIVNRDRCMWYPAHKLRHFINSNSLALDHGLLLNEISYRINSLQIIGRNITNLTCLAAKYKTHELDPDIADITYSDTASIYVDLVESFSAIRKIGDGADNIFSRVLRWLEMMYRDMYHVLGVITTPHEPANHGALIRYMQDAASLYDGRASKSRQILVKRINLIGGMRQSLLIQLSSCHNIETHLSRFVPMIGAIVKSINEVGDDLIG